MRTEREKRGVDEQSHSADESRQWPPSWRTFPHGISVGRYIDPAFLRLEFERLWKRVWQVAAREDEIPQTGDYTTYQIGDQSVLLVRVDAQTISAYYNSCPHRGTALAAGCGTFDKARIICPFHGWRWNLAGKNEFVLERQEFRGGKLQDSDVALRGIKTVTFAGFVFISFAVNPEPFDTFIEPIRALLEGMSIADMHHYWWKSIPIASNWKVAQEAFFETYHVPATHPQLETAAAAVIYDAKSEEGVQYQHRNVTYETFPFGHGRFYAGANSPMAGKVKPQIGGDLVEAMAARLQLIVDGMDAQVLQGDVEVLLTLRGKEIPAGSSLGGEYVKALYAKANMEQRPMPKLTPEILGMWGGEVFIFPNVMILPQAGNAMIYRVRPHPTDPDRCTFEILSTTTLPSSVTPPRAVVQQVTDSSDRQQVLLIPSQDLGNIPRMQIGLHAYGMRQTWLAGNHEKMIVNMHQELDRYLLP